MVRKGRLGQRAAGAGGRLGLILLRKLRGNNAVRIAHGFPALDLVDVLHTLRDLTPDGILPIEPGRVCEADEELAVGRVRILCARHGDGAAYMLLLGKFRLELSTRAPGSGSLRATRLCHEAVDDTVKHKAVVEPAADQLSDAGNMIGSKIGAHGDCHPALGGLKNERVVSVAHQLVPGLLS